ncbi:MAG: hypothetical protein D6698_04955 [Gammaproteobacteria bacterium]|nr:MAG: hypothetical protein D6698_04955 [Gammaproteobacteria bacterium]
METEEHIPSVDYFHRRFAEEQDAVGKAIADLNLTLNKAGVTTLLKSFSIEVLCGTSLLLITPVHRRVLKGEDMWFVELVNKPDVPNDHPHREVLDEIVSIFECGRPSSVIVELVCKFVALKMLYG